MIKKFDEFLNEDVVLLRTMSLKSILNFGKYSGMSIQQILDLKKTGYLRYLYYNKEGITFVDDILKIIGVIGNNFDYRIDKPGKNPELCKKIFKEKEKYYDKGINDYIKRNKMARKIDYDYFDKRKFTKGNLQAWNHGR